MPRQNDIYRGGGLEEERSVKLAELIEAIE
jgi:hypothetical protein